MYTEKTKREGETRRRVFFSYSDIAKYFFMLFKVHIVLQVWKRKPCKVLITFVIEKHNQCKSNACVEVYPVLSRKHLMSAWVCFHILFANIKVASIELYVVPRLKGLGHCRWHCECEC